LIRSYGPNILKAYVRRNKNDAADAAAICEAVRRPTMRFIAVKSAHQQAQLIQHRTRDLLVRQRTQVINALRAHMAELGIVAAQGHDGVKKLLAIIADEKDERLPVDARASLIVLTAQLQALQTMIRVIEKRIIAQHRASEASKRVATIPGIGRIAACQAEPPEPSLAGAVAGTTSIQGRRHCACQQDGTHRLGTVGQG
jgi:transposase